MWTGLLFPASVPTHRVNSSGAADTRLPRFSTGIPDSCQRWATAGVCPRNSAMAFQPCKLPESELGLGAGFGLIFRLGLDPDICLAMVLPRKNALDLRNE